MQKMILFLLLLIVPVPGLAQGIVPKSAKAYGYFPHIVAGGGWQTTFTISNPYSEPVTASVSFIGDDGEELPLDLGRGLWLGVISEIPAFGTEEFTVGLPGTLQSETLQGGWASLSASDFVVALATYSWAPDGVPLSSVSVPATVPTVRYFSPGTPNLGIAVGNVYHDSELTVSVTAHGNDGASYSETLSLPAKGHSARLLKDVIPNLPTDFAGTVHMHADGNSFSVLALKDNANGVYSSLPGGEAVRPPAHFDLIRNVFARLLSKHNLSKHGKKWTGKKWTWR